MKKEEQNEKRKLTLREKLKDKRIKRPRINTNRKK